MKLSEIIKVPQQSTHGFDLEKFKNAKPFKQAKVESYPLLFNNEGDDYFFTFKIDDENAAYMKAVHITDMSGEVFMVKRTFVVPKFRNKGLMTALYQTLHNQHIVLISDSELSPESISIWKKLNKHHEIKIIDRNTGEIRKSYDEDFDPTDRSLEFDHYILEDHKPNKIGWTKEPNNFVVEELNIFIKRNLL
jgi:hypothetical protein